MPVVPTAPNAWDQRPPLRLRGGGLCLCLTYDCEPFCGTALLDSKNAGLKGWISAVFLHNGTNRFAKLGHIIQPKAGPHGHAGVEGEEKGFG